jgi:hypothetical protein
VLVVEANSKTATRWCRFKFLTSTFQHQSSVGLSKLGVGYLKVLMAKRVTRFVERIGRGTS